MKKLFLILFLVLFFTMPVWAAGLAWEQPKIENVVGWRIETSATDDPAAFTLMVFDGFDGKLMKADAIVEAGEYIFALPVDLTGKIYFRVKSFNHLIISEPSQTVLGIFEADISTPVNFRFISE